MSLADTCLLRQPERVRSCGGSSNHALDVSRILVVDDQASRGPTPCSRVHPTRRLGARREKRWHLEAPGAELTRAARGQAVNRTVAVAMLRKVPNKLSRACPRGRSVLQSILPPHLTMTCPGKGRDVSS